MATVNYRVPEAEFITADKAYYHKASGFGGIRLLRVVEAGCKVAIGTWLENAGMRWSLAGANAIIALRCCQLSGRFDAFWIQRSLACQYDNTRSAPTIPATA